MWAEVEGSGKWWDPTVPCSVPQEVTGPLREDFSLSSSALIGLLVIAVAVAMVIVISLVMLRKRQYGSISHGIVEVSRRKMPPFSSTEN